MSLPAPLSHWQTHAGDWEWHRPPKKSHYDQVAYLRVKRAHAIFITYPTVLLHHHESKLFEDKWSAIPLLLVSPIIRVQGSFASRQGLTGSHLWGSLRPEQSDEPIFISLLYHRFPSFSSTSEEMISAVWNELQLFTYCLNTKPYYFADAVQCCW